MLLDHEWELAKSPAGAWQWQPVDIDEADIVFEAARYVSNGRIEDVNHLVYVDPERYGTLESRADLKAVGRAVGELNKLLPKRQFILIGPGRWGSRIPISWSLILKRTCWKTRLLHFTG